MAILKFLIVVFLGHIKFSLYFGEQVCNLFLWNFVLLQDCRMLPVELIHDLAYVRVQDQAL